MVSGKRLDHVKKSVNRTECRAAEVTDQHPGSTKRTRSGALVWAETTEQTTGTAAAAFREIRKSRPPLQVYFNSRPMYHDRRFPHK